MLSCSANCVSSLEGYQNNSFYILKNREILKNVHSNQPPPTNSPRSACIRVAMVKNFLSIVSLNTHKKSLIQALFTVSSREEMMSTFNIQSKDTTV